MKLRAYDTEVTTRAQDGLVVHGESFGATPGQVEEGHMNAYQKTAILVTGAFLPLLLLFMKAMGVVGVWIAGAVGMSLTAAVVYALRHARTE